MSTPSPAALRVVERFNSSKNAAVIYKGKRLTWGWLAQGPQRMHLVSLGQDHQEGVVWLEDDLGNRAFEVEGLDEDLEVEGLKTWVSRNRHYFERLWLDHMIAKGWLGVEATGTAVVVTAYPGSSSEIRREIDLSNCPCWITSEDVAVEKGTLVIGVGRKPQEQVQMKLREIIWRGPADGSEGGMIPF